MNVTHVTFLAATSAGSLSLAAHWTGWAVVLIFVIAYVLVIFEERLHLAKSIPVMAAAALIWTILAFAYAAHGDQQTAAIAVRHYLHEYGELLLFLMVAMTYINSMDERGVFDALRAWLVRRRFSRRQLFWITGALAFFISPVADNMTTALIMGSIVLAVGRHPHFVSASCINVVVAANAGGAFSPFGDITTLMVWQKGIIEFSGFFALFIPSLVNWLVPAAIMARTLDTERPEVEVDEATVLPGGIRITLLFFGTIALTVGLHSLAHLPPAFGMMAGLAVLKIYGWRLHKKEDRIFPLDTDYGSETPEKFSVFRQFERLEWDTLLFFYGVVLCVGGLHTLGYLTMVSTAMYGGWGPTASNVMIGLASSVLDNIPLMFAVLAVQPDMNHAQWLLVTLTAGVGGSLFSIGSAAGVALMGLARGIYTFSSHLKWTWAVLLGYILSILSHVAINGR